MSYTIALHDFPHIPEDERIQPQDPYCRALAKALDAPDAVLLGYRAWLNISESGNDQPSQAKPR